MTLSYPPDTKLVEFVKKIFGNSDITRQPVKRRDNQHSDFSALAGSKELLQLFSIFGRAAFRLRPVDSRWGRVLILKEVICTKGGGSPTPTE